MKKETFNIVLLILLIALAGIYLIIRDMNNVEESKNIISINNDSIFEIDIKTKSDIIIDKDSDLWIINTGKLEYKADQKKIEIIIKTLENLSYRRIIDKNAENLKKYGLENPSVTVVMHLKNDVSITLSIGDETSSGSQFYAMVRGDKTVYTIDSAFVKTLTGTVLDFRDRNISVTTEYLIDEIRIAREGAETILLNKIPDRGWLIINPIQMTADSEYVNESLSMIHRLTMNDVHLLTDENSRKFGLDSPELSISLTESTGIKQTFNLGKRFEETGMSYIYIEGEKEIFETRANSLYEIDLDKMIFFAPLSVSSDDVEQIEMVQGDVKQILQRKYKDDREVFYSDEKEIPQEDYISLYVNLMSMTVDGYAEKKPEQAMILALTLKRDQQENISVYIYDYEDEYYAMSSSLNQYQFIISKDKVELVIKWFDKINQN